MVTPTLLLNALYFLVNARKVLINDGSTAIAAPDCRDAPGQNPALTCAPVPSRPGRETQNATRSDASSNIDDSGSGYARIQREYEKTRGRRLRGPPQITNWPGASIDDDGAGHLAPGSLVELHGDRSVLATPAVITARSEGSTPASARYDVTSAIYNVPSFDVDPVFIHPYHVYEDGTEAYCNVGTLRGAHNMAPCTVEAHFTKTSGFISYQVTYVDASKNEVRVHLPFSKVQRKLR